eukprot:4520642-Amphidinium_carterae.1
MEICLDRRMHLCNIQELMGTIPPSTHETPPMHGELWRHLDDSDCFPKGCVDCSHKLLLCFVAEKVAIHDYSGHPTASHIAVVGSSQSRTPW